MHSGYHLEDVPSTGHEHIFGLEPLEHANKKNGQRRAGPTIPPALLATADEVIE
jgi:hypothetical protein